MKVNVQAAFPHKSTNQALQDMCFKREKANEGSTGVAEAEDFLSVFTSPCTVLVVKFSSEQIGISWILICSW